MANETEDQLVSHEMSWFHSGFFLTKS